MDNTQLILLCFAIAVIAFLYSSVGTQALPDISRP